MDSTIRTIIIACAMWGIFLHAQQTQELFLLGNKEYEKGDFSQALRHYQAIKKKGPAVWYNMGNCYYGEQDFVQAIVCWQRSLHGASQGLYQDAQRNCAYAYQKIGKPVSVSFIDTAIDYAYKMPTLLLQLLFLFCWYLLWLASFTWHKTWRTYLLILILLGSIIYLGFVIWHRYQQQCHEYGIITQKEAPLYVGPHTKYHTLGTIDSGQKVVLVEKRPEWYKVSKDGAYGWIPSCAVEVINHHS